MQVLDAQSQSNKTNMSLTQLTTLCIIAQQLPTFKTKTLNYKTTFFLLLSFLNSTPT